MTYRSHNVLMHKTSLYVQMLKKKHNLFNRHTRKAARMVTNSVQLVVKPWKEGISNSTEKMIV